MNAKNVDPHRGQPRKRRPIVPASIIKQTMDSRAKRAEIRARTPTAFHSFVGVLLGEVKIRSLFRKQSL